MAPPHHLVFRHLLGAFLDNKIAQCPEYTYGSTKNFEDDIPTTWPDGPDTEFPWLVEPRNQSLDIGGGCRFILRRTKAIRGSQLDEYAWRITSNLIKPQCESFDPLP